MIRVLGVGTARLVVDAPTVWLRPVRPHTRACVDCPGVVAGRNKRCPACKRARKRTQNASYYRQPQYIKECEGCRATLHDNRFRLCTRCRGEDDAGSTT